MVARKTHNFNECALKKLYDVFKTHELEIQHYKGMKKGTRKQKSVTLVSRKDVERRKALKTVTAKSVPSINVCESGA